MNWSRFPWFTDGRPWIPGERPVYWQGRQVTLGQVHRVVTVVLVSLAVLGAGTFASLVIFIGNPTPACVAEQDPTRNDEVDCANQVEAWCAQNHADEDQNTCELKAFGIIH
jgi:hypothetical protein